MEQTLPVKLEEDENPVFADDNDDLYKSLERTRKLALKKQEEAASGPQAVALLATTAHSSQTTEDQNPTTGESQEKGLSLQRWRSLSGFSSLMKVFFFLRLFMCLHRIEI